MKSKVGPQINPIGMLNSNSYNNKQNSDQKVFQPAAIAQKRKTSKPKMKYLNDGSCRVTHREYLRDINGSFLFNAMQLRINPGLEASFPWLSPIANRYESYLFEKLCFEFCTEAPSVATGTVMLTVDFDPTDNPPIDKIQALSYEGAVRSPTWSDCCYEAARHNLNKRKSYFTRQSIADDSDITTKDVGNLFLCTSGQASASPVGELWVSYTIVLTTPQISTPTIGDALKLGGSNVQGSAGIVVNLTTRRGNLPIDFDDGTITFQTTGHFLVDIYAYQVVGNPGFNAGNTITPSFLFAQNEVDSVDFLNSTVQVFKSSIITAIAGQTKFFPTLSYNSPVTGIIIITRLNPNITNFDT